MKDLYAHSDEYPIIGQECICPDGLGRVMSFDFNIKDNYFQNYIQVQTYINSRDCQWRVSDVTLIPIYI